MSNISVLRMIASTLRTEQNRSVARMRPSFFTTSATPCKNHHKLCGYMAGLHSHGDHPEFPSFQSAWEAVTEVDATLLDDFEEQLWSEQGRKFIHGTRKVSVVDTKNDDCTVTRKLVLNERPNLVQTAIQVESIAAPYCPLSPSPPLLTQTHLGGLAMAVPFWRLNNSETKSSPHCVLIGAGGCSLPAILACHLGNAPSVVAIEPCREVLLASKLWFGADESAKFSLVCQTGNDYLQSSLCRAIDVLIIDADDGLAPPASMRTQSFWESIALPTLSHNCVVGVNVIGNQNERDELQNVLRKTLPTHYDVISVSAPPEAGVSSRHALFFAIPEGILQGTYNFENFVDMPHCWKKEVDSSYLSHGKN
mmetsp:Transcript_61535/g.71907  ORF Transcript_61535/g.71907 Transcript_61535/m.71907 type:complete len:365 (-) Transcript_61535:49-1143(-)